ncbi:MAG: zinc ABC transporter substrate-binding protein [Actinobacteria bacterium]|nr:zinc ABC transporter substrate-binding protein [Actinomycetota bacterium]
MVLMFSVVAKRAVTVLVAAWMLTGCGSGNTPARPKPLNGPMKVVAAIYPLAYAAERIGGEDVTVSTLAATGVEPHEQELTAKQVGAVELADVVVYVKGLAGAVDAAVSQSSAVVVDALAAVGSGKRANDPHLWLNPLRLVEVGAALATNFSKVDPTHAANYQARARAFTSDLTHLDADIKSETKSCANRLLVTTHTSLGYFASRYGFRQVSVLGADPESEPTPATLARIIKFVKTNNITTLYGEVGHTSKALNTVAKETGAVVRLLQTLEAPPLGTDYPSAMRENAAVVVAGQKCGQP